MEGLQLVGYTADLKYLVFVDASDAAARYRVPLDGDLLATFDEIDDLLRGGRRPSARPASPAPARTAPPRAEREQAAKPLAPDATRKASDGPAATAASEHTGPSEGPPHRRGPRPGEGVLAGLAVVASTPPALVPDQVGRRHSRLSPRDIQSRLRAGANPRQVAREADTSEEWVLRWQPPIEAEREQVLAAVWRSRVAKPRLGPSADVVGDAVAINLRAKGMDAATDDVEWSAVRKDGDAYWTVTLRYRTRGRKQRALWRYDPEKGELDCRNAGSVELAWTRPGGQPGVETSKSGSKRPRTSPAKGGGRARKGSGPRSGAEPSQQATVAGPKSTAKQAPAGPKSAAKQAPAGRKSAAKQAPAGPKSAAKQAPAGPRRRRSVAVEGPGPAVVPPGADPLAPPADPDRDDSGHG